MQSNDIQQYFKYELQYSKYNYITILNIIMKFATSFLQHSLWFNIYTCILHTQSHKFPLLSQ